MAMMDLLIVELQHEASATRRVLESLPAEQFGWKPHDKSMEAGRLAGHIAEIPGWGPDILQADHWDLGAPDGYNAFVPSSQDELLDGHEKAVAVFLGSAQGVSDEMLAQLWQLRMGGKVVSESPRGGVVRSFVLNHIVHHRAQLGVYLRLLGIPVPSVYGPSADDPGAMG
ncbi:MAG: DinB family protein [Acidobacteriota bacterium]